MCVYVYGECIISDNMSLYILPCISNNLSHTGNSNAKHLHCGYVCGIIVIMYLDERQANTNSIHVVPVVSNEINENTCSVDVIVT